MATRPSLTDRSDAELVDDARRGSRDAFAELYRRHAGAARLAISDNVHDRERQRDLLQDVFTRAFARLHALREPERFRPWVLQIARNAAIDDLRARSAVRVETIDDHTDLASIGDETEIVAEVRRIAAAIEAGIGGLSPREAAAMSMTIHLGFGPTEIAAALGTTYGNAKVIVHRARARLREAADRETVTDVDGTR